MMWFRTFTLPPPSIEMPPPLIKSNFGMGAVCCVGHDVCSEMLQAICLKKGVQDPGDSHDFQSES